MELLDYQLKNANETEAIFQKYPISLNTSPLGSGKTYLTLYLAQKYNMEVIVIGPKTMGPIWSDLAQTFDIPLIDYISYQKLRSIKGKDPKHSYLKRIETESGPVFEPTPKWIELIQRGILVVFDEIQLIKNSTDQHDACQALTSSIIRYGEYSRVLLLSGSPFDKEQHAVNLLRLMGFIQSSIVKHPRSKAEPSGLLELLEKCRRIDSEKTDYLLKLYSMTNQKVQNFCYRLFIDIIRPEITTQMPLPPIETEKDVKNAFYTITEEEERQLRESILSLATASRYNRATESADLKDTDWQAVTQALMRIEFAKIPILVRETRRVLDSHSKAKVVIFVQFTETLMRLRELLNGYSLGMIYGATSTKDREVAIREFQENPEMRLLIGNLRVGGIGISLHDRIGDAPRTMFVIPNYSLLDLHQATGRIYRQGTKSVATIRFVYGNIQNNIREVNILNALARKTKVIREILDIHADQICFPGDYEDLIVE